MNNHHRDRSRLGVLVPISITYLAVAFLIRLGLMVFEGNWALFLPLPLARIFAIGLLYDIAALSWILVPFVINALVWPGRPWGRKAHAGAAIFLVMTGAVIFGANTIGEFLFWNEFSARYNFIAVDYLIYTREVTGNIAQSYPMVWLVLACAGIILVMMFVTLPFVWRRAQGAAPGLKRRGVIAAGYVILLCGVFFGVNETPHTWMHGAAEKELASCSAPSGTTISTMKSFTQRSPKTRHSQRCAGSCKTPVWRQTKPRKTTALPTWSSRQARRAAKTSSW